MSYYRDTYLKSDHWKTLRVKLISRTGGICEVCGFYSLSNDVHHVRYKHLFDVTILDLRVVCRSCHEQIHILMKKYPLLKNQVDWKQWEIIKSRLLRAVKAEAVKNHKAKQRGCGARREKSRARDRFSIARNVLHGMGVIHKGALKWKIIYENLPIYRKVKRLAKTPFAMLDYFVNVLGVDPRKNQFKQIKLLR